MLRMRVGDQVDEPAAGWVNRGAQTRIAEVDRFGMVRRAGEEREGGGGVGVGSNG